MIQILKSCTGSASYVIEKELGNGGQGHVFLVQDSQSATQYAAKWYRPTTGTESQRKQITELIARGKPHTQDSGIHFVWPLELLFYEDSSEFGYLMPLIETQRFHSPSRIWNRAIKQPVLPVLCRICYRLAAAIETLHAAGLAYCDLNDKNIMIDTLSGEIVIYDNDNVVVNNASTPIKGVWEFIAPEVFIGGANPNAESDLYSAAVLLYYLWMWEHPMEGAATLRMHSWDIPAKRKFFAETPVFVFHPTDTSNTAFGIPDLRLHVERWTRMCPPRLQRMFIDTFVEGIHSPFRRKRLADWQRVFLELEANTIACDCEALNVWDGETPTLTCWKCAARIPIALALRCRHGSSGDSWVLARAGALLRQHHLDINRFDKDATLVIGRVEPHPEAPGHAIIRNLSQHAWNYAVRGHLVAIAPGQANALIPGGLLTVGNTSISVESIQGAPPP